VVAVHVRHESHIREARLAPAAARPCSTQLRSVENLIARYLDARAGGHETKRWKDDAIDKTQLLHEREQALTANP